MPSSLSARLRSRPIVPLAVRGTDLELQVVSEIVGLDALHYGYRDGGRRAIRTLGEMRAAQDRYTRTLVRWVPRVATRVLDVGCGMGDIARALAARGHAVTAISPDHHYARFFARNGHGSGVRFVPVRFEDFTTDRPFDLVLMSESNNYFDPVEGLDRTRAALRPGGYLLISGIFKRRHAHGVNSDMCTEEEYRTRARSGGFVLLRRQDITREVAPTLDFARGLLDRFAIPTARAFTSFVVHGSPLIRVATWLLRLDPSARVERVADFYRRRMSRAFFSRHHAYVRCLFRYGGAPAD